MSSTVYKDDCQWGSRRLYLMALLTVNIGTAIFTSIPTSAIAQGTLGYTICIVLAFVFIGIPLLYLEFIVSQFTARNCLDVWKVRACLSHIGYVQICWQVFYIVYNHTVTAFIIHFFLISFEDPIPYYMCGKWSTKICNIALYNFTVNQDCIKSKEKFSHCEFLHTSFPEYQYWRFYILGGKETHYYVAWRVCLASSLACALIYLSCFKRKTSMKWFLIFFTVYPTVGYIVLFIGSMTQKGIVVKFEEAFDTNFTTFVRKFRLTEVILYVLDMLNIGSGISFNLASSTSFRAPCYSNIVITVVVCATFVVIVNSTTTMMTCPYAYEYNCKPAAVMALRISPIFEKIPRLLKEFDNRSVWLILSFSCNAVLGFSTNSIIFLSLFETFASKNAILDKYAGLVTFAAVIILFLITIPLLGSSGVYAVFDFRRYFSLINVFIGMIESIVFVVCYGLDKFSEDVHFMQGIQPKSLMKLAWATSSIVLAIVFVNEFYHKVSLPANSNYGSKAGHWFLIFLSVFIVLTAVVKLIVAACKKRFADAYKLDPSWGPRSEVLLRSRAMFSAQAMTKEYMYRQYHLQAGILKRQKASNIRRERTL